MRESKVLVVDDKPANHLALAAVLEEDHELRFANSGPEAIDMLVRSPDVDVILMDVHMPEMDAFECAVSIKKTERSVSPLHGLGVELEESTAQ
jgi:CheY-like chemotaxis protein